ncbi:K(+)-transporting ATPase subunit F [Acuticoccus sediminis]|nr:K(+)-transporting ATPase subunit F [Acuticoccus sediminis]
MTLEFILGGAVALGLLIYLGFAFASPEKY